jgi:hypothetical protein
MDTSSMNKKIIFGWLAVISLLVVLAFFVTTSKELPEQEASIQNISTIEVTLAVAGQTYTAQVPAQSNVYDAMRVLASTTAFTFNAKYYEGMGYLIEEINGEKSSDGAYWTLYVNNVMSTVGVSQYVLAPHDAIEWKLEKM